MEQDRASHTAEFVCLARAAAHGRTGVARFADATAAVLLSDEGRATLSRLFGEGESQPEDVLIQMRSEVMVARTVAVDDAIRSSNNPQLVNLGAGYDGRAWRMSELAGAIVFEVDHPATQKQKRERAAALTLVAREVRFVAVDFTRDALDVALAVAGHDARVPTTWLWEGVVPYLTSAEVNDSLTIIKQRSAPGSRLVIVYQAPPFAAPSTGPAASPPFGQVGLSRSEPLRSFWTPAQMRQLLERAAFRVAADQDLVELATACGADLSLSGPMVSTSRVVNAKL